MRVAYPMRVDAIDKPGGDVLQVLQYIEAGKRAGEDGHPRFEGTLISDLRADLSGFDLIHLTNIDRPVDTYRSFLLAKETGKPIFLSPIHHSYEEIERFERVGRNGGIGLISGLLDFPRLEYLRSVLRSSSYLQLASPTLMMMRRGMGNSQKAVLRGVDRILVLTEKEKTDIIRNFGAIPDEKFVCLRNGFEGDVSGLGETSVRDIDVCMVGRIEARKNQIAVLRVLNRLGMGGVFVGSKNVNNKSYCRKFEKMLMDSKCRYMGGISHEETLGIMRRARVHISASWFEVLSLVDLEAYWAGCGVVSSQCGGTRELLRDRAEYVDPGSENSIQEGILRMLEKRSVDLCGCANGREEKSVLETWDEVGTRLASLYRQSICKKDLSF